MENKHPNLVKIGKLIREQRKNLGLSQEGLAEKAGMGRTCMGRVERGEQNISVQNLICVALTLKVEVAELLPLKRNLIYPSEHSN